MAAASVSLKEYLKKYQSEADDKTKKKKKKKMPNINPVGSGVIVVDEDPVWQKPVHIEDPDDEESADEVPQVDEDIEVKRMRRLEAIRSRKPYHSINDDGSGWVSVSDQPKGADSDLSPPRTRRSRFDSPSPEREVKAEPDLSPLRQQCRRADTPSPVREVNADPDLSPPRQRGRRADTPSPVQEVKAEPDLSPPRQRRRRADTPDDDLSLPRRNGGRSEEADLSPPRRSRTRLVEGSERGGDGDLLLPRRSRGRGDGDEISPPRSSRGRSPDGDLSPPRRRKEADLSPPRRKKEVRRTGLISAEEIRKENEKKRKADLKRFASMNASVSGKGAEPVFRDKEGKRISKEEILKKDEEEKPKEKKLEWGKGLAQKREAEARARELELEKEKPFARTRDDPELEKMLKERVRWGDPMAHLVKKTSEPVLEDLGDDEKMMDSGFLIPQTVPSHSWIKRGIDCPPNRYGIRPGRHWDGVDRSNGYEKELFKRQNEKRATESEAYLWSVADM